MADRIADLDLEVNITGHGNIILRGVEYDPLEGEWILFEDHVDEIIRTWSLVNGHESLWDNEEWVLGWVRLSTPGIMPNLTLGLWIEAPEDGEWKFSDFPFDHLRSVTEPPEPEAEIVPDERPSDTQFRHFGMEVAATLALWSQREFDADEMLADLAGVGRKRLNMSIDRFEADSPERQAMWRKLAEALGVEGPEEEDE